MATTHRLAQSPPGWTQQAQLLQAQSRVPWQLSGNVSLFQLDSQQQLKNMQSHQLQQDWIPNPESAKRQLPGTEDSGSDPSAHRAGEALKEKNRKAQAKHRAKQKIKLSEAEDRVADLTRQLEELKSELATASGRNVVLEKVFELQNGSPQIAGSDEDQPTTSGSELVPYNVCNPISAPIDVNAILNTRKEQQTLIQFTPSQLKALEWKDFVKLWKEYVSRLAVCLVEARGDDTCPAAKRVEVILDELMQFFCYLSASNPKMAMKFKHLRLEPSSSHDDSSGPSQEKWSDIATAANFDEQQQLELCGTRQYLVTNMDRIMQERAEISLQLGSAVPSQGGSGLQHQLATDHIQARRATERLHQNLQQAQECLSRFQIACKAIMTPLQIAMVCVQAYPWMPDILALTDAVSKLQGGDQEPCAKKAGK